MKRIGVVLLALILLLLSVALGEEVLVDGDYATDGTIEVEYGEAYDTPEEVALYLHAFVELPYNFITKAEARDLGWVSSAGNLWDVAYGYSIGGDKFGNREGLLPDARGRQWYECDVNYRGGYRGSERLLFSSDGIICYSDDHYQTYTELYDAWYDELEPAA